MQPVTIGAYWWKERINAREIEVSVGVMMTRRLHCRVEIIPADEFYSYEAKYFDDRSRLIIPAPSSDDGDPRDPKPRFH